MRGAHRTGTMVPRGVRRHRCNRGRGRRGRGPPRAEAAAEEGGAQYGPQQKIRGIIAANDEQVRRSCRIRPTTILGREATCERNVDAKR